MIHDDPPSPEFSERFFTIKEVADLFHVDPDTIEDLIHEQRLRAVRVGRRTIRVPASAIEEFVRANSTILSPPQSSDSSTQSPDHQGRGTGGGQDERKPLERLMLLDQVRGVLRRERIAPT